MTARKLFVALVMAALVVPAADASATHKKTTPPIVTTLLSCQQTSDGANLDTFELIFQTQATKPKRKRHKKKRPAHAAAAKPLLAGAKVSATLDGPYVTDGEATGTTNAKGTVDLTLTFGGPGTYTLSWKATKRGYKAGSGSQQITVAGPTNAPCTTAEVA